MENDLWIYIFNVTAWQIINPNNGYIMPMNVNQPIGKITAQHSGNAGNEDGLFFIHLFKNLPMGQIKKYAVNFIFILRTAFVCGAQSFFLFN